MRLRLVYQGTYQTADTLRVVYNIHDANGPVVCQPDREKRVTQALEYAVGADYEVRARTDRENWTERFEAVRHVPLTVEIGGER